MGVTNSNKVADTAAICCGDQFKMTLALTGGAGYRDQPDGHRARARLLRSMSGAPLADMKLGRRRL